MVWETVVRLCPPLLRLTGARANPPKFFNLLELFVTPETPEAELARLLKEQDETMQDEIFVGMSRAVRAEYERRAKRIEELRVALRNERDGRMKAEHQNPCNDLRDSGRKSMG